LQDRQFLPVKGRRKGLQVLASSVEVVKGFATAEREVQKEDTLFHWPVRFSDWRDNVNLTESVSKQSEGMLAEKRGEDRLLLELERRFGFGRGRVQTIELQFQHGAMLRKDHEVDHACKVGCAHFVADESVRPKLNVLVEICLDVLKRFD
jgi:hypothetical protein